MIPINDGKQQTGIRPSGSGGCHARPGVEWATRHTVVGIAAAGAAAGQPADRGLAGEATDAGCHRRQGVERGFGHLAKLRAAAWRAAWCNRCARRRCGGR
ncbi:hypothetical protein [Parapedobacter pyrenivorans]|uniref:hypothetical protein n=1 Tax=Parapedobacter pyrenivorans TaxID=1305674 RepID=UPI00166EF7D8|nr:hypothetical protein [Parapedobacter pyrenivorans]